MADDSRSMVISRTPFRVSFFGGGTDYPTWYEAHGGAVLAATIAKYCYLSCRWFPNYFDAKYRIVYSRIELHRDVADIEHPSVRACLGHLGIKDGIEIVHNADLPARSGLGSSSSFTVGLLNALHALHGRKIERQELADCAIHIEQKVIGENVGAQDQMMAAHGGLNLLTFDANGFKAHPLLLSNERIAELESHLMLVWTGLSRNASDVAAQQIRNIPQRARELDAMRSMVDEAMGILMSGRDLADFGALLHESWQLKRRLSDRISSPLVDDLYAVARANGALGGKLLGAGGGGFFLIMARPEDQPAIREALSPYMDAPVKFDFAGSQIIFQSQD
ncbi:MAG: kinase [Bacteroidota bacterium]